MTVGYSKLCQMYIISDYEKTNSNWIAFLHAHNKVSIDTSAEDKHRCINYSQEPYPTQTFIKTIYYFILNKYCEKIS